MITLVNWQQEEPIGYGGGRQLSMDGTSRVTGDSHARICERLGVKIPGATRRRSAMAVPTATVLPAAVAKDPERLARFEREAKVLASLNHPNIAQNIRT
jgi:serine/threonine protein kinase